jgi:hypothetical protein
MSHGIYGACVLCCERQGIYFKGDGVGAIKNEKGDDGGGGGGGGGDGGGG